MKEKDKKMAAALKENNRLVFQGLLSSMIESFSEMDQSTLFTAAQIVSFLRDTSKQVDKMGR